VLAKLREQFPHWAQRLGDDHVLNIDVLGQISDTALTRDAEIALQADGLPNTFVPARNLIFLTLAAALAYRRRCAVLVGGMCETDFSGYPDCRDTTMQAMQLALTLGMGQAQRIETPLMWIDKAQTWALTHALGGDALVQLTVQDTHTCYRGDREHLHDWGHGCGTCPACELRATGFRKWQAGKAAQARPAETAEAAGIAETSEISETAEIAETVDASATASTDMTVPVTEAAEAAEAADGDAHDAPARALHALRRAAQAGAWVKYLCFWGHTDQRPGEVTPACLSQWYPAAFEVDGLRYPTAEHFMMAEKARLFGDEAARLAIVQAAAPGAAKALGRGVQGFDEARWQAARYAIVVRGNAAKFGQNPALRAFLLNTGERVLVEASPVDRIWGIGLAADDVRAQQPEHWPGQNLLGFALMDVRRSLRAG
jgi:7-cyano-7-deazaguanine synthase